MDDSEEDDMLEFEKVLGSGSFGTVYLIRDKLNRRYAVKRINFTGQESERNDAKREADILARVRHDNVLNYIESFEDEDCLNIVTEYCDGGDLDDYLKKRQGKKLPETRICHWIHQIANGLQYLHGQKILHRDLKSKNIFLMGDLSLKLGDLGIAKLLELNQTKADSFVGTPAYMSPELFKHLPYNHKSDIWSFGCCAFEMVGLQKPFGNDGLFVLCKKVCSSERPPIPDVYSGGLKSLIYSMLHESPDSRPNARDILQHTHIVTKLSVPIDKSNSPDRTSALRAREKSLAASKKPASGKTPVSGKTPASGKASAPGKTQGSARERRRQRGLVQRSKTFSSSWKEIKQQIETHKNESHRRSVSKTMAQMKNLKIGVRRPGSGGTESISSYSNDDDDDGTTFLDNDQTYSSERAISRVKSVNHNSNMSLLTHMDSRDGSHSYIDDEEDDDDDDNDMTFIRRRTTEIDPQVVQVCNNLPDNPDMAAKLMVQQMTQNLTSFESLDTNTRRIGGSRTQDNVKKNGQTKPRKKKKILTEIAVKRRSESTSSDTGIGSISSTTQGQSGTTSLSHINPQLLTAEDTGVQRKRQEEITLFTHGQQVRFSKSADDNEDEEDTAAGGKSSKHYVPFEKKKTTESVKSIMALIGSPENKTMCTDLISDLQLELAHEIGEDNLKKCYQVMDGIQDDKIVKALLTEIVGQKKFEEFKEHLFYLRMLERSLQAQD